MARSASENLSHEIVGHALARLVAVEQIVAERLDDVIERAGDVGDTGFIQQAKSDRRMPRVAPTSTPLREVTLGARSATGTTRKFRPR